MCGIAGAWLSDPSGRIDESLIVPMADVLHHRGPDQWGYYLGRGASALLVSTRLAIVDLANGRQPLCNEDGTVWVILNGEIYDFARIARELKVGGHRFRTQTDTEVVVHLYEEYGEHFVDHLRGEFAIALLDERVGALYLVRDRFGIKPLFYADVPGGHVFGSEIKALFQHPGVPRRLNRERVFQTVQGLLVPGDTYFEGVRELEPGCLLRASESGVQISRYWDLPFSRTPAPIADEQEAIDEYRRLLHEAVTLRLHGDVEVGTYLSGGVDSMAIAATAHDVSGAPLKAFTIAFDNERFDESPLANRFASGERLDQHVVRIGAGDLAPAFERSLWHSEIVVANSHGVARLLLSELAGRHVKVVLTGEGADESAAGYNVFRHLTMLEHARAHPQDRQVRADVDALVKELGFHSGILPIREYIDYERIRGLFGFYPYAMARSLKLRRSSKWILSRAFRQSMADVDPIDQMATRFGRHDGLDAVSGHQLYTFKTELACYILAGLGDRVEMAHSLEGRLPFLDHKLVEFSCALPVNLRLRGRVGKFILRQAMASRVPGAMELRKRPFMAPAAETLGLDRGSEHIGRYLDRRTTARVGIFDPSAIALVRRSLRLLPTHSYARSLAETMITMVASVHALHDLFCERFDDSVSRYRAGGAVRRVQDGLVTRPSAAGAITV